MPNCAQILPQYRKKLGSIRTVYTFSAAKAKRIRKLLTEPVKEKRARLFFNLLSSSLGSYSESGVTYRNLGFALFLLSLCQDMPWNFFALYEIIKKCRKIKKAHFLILHSRKRSETNQNLNTLRRGNNHGRRFANILQNFQIQSI